MRSRDDRRRKNWKPLVINDVTYDLGDVDPDKHEPHKTWLPNTGVGGTPRGDDWDNLISESGRRGRALAYHEFVNGPLPEPEKPHVCVCGRGYVRISGLTKHQATCKIKEAHVSSQLAASPALTPALTTAIVTGVNAGRLIASGSDVAGIDGAARPNPEPLPCSAGATGAAGTAGTAGTAGGNSGATNMAMPGGHAASAHVNRSTVAGTAASPALAPALTAAAAAAGGDSGGGLFQLEEKATGTDGAGLSHPFSEDADKYHSTAAAAAAAGGGIGKSFSGGAKQSPPRSPHVRGFSAGAARGNVGVGGVGGVPAPPALPPALTAAAAATRGNAGGANNIGDITSFAQLDPGSEAQAVGDAAAQWSEEDGGSAFFADEDDTHAAAAATAARSNQRRAVAFAPSVPNPNAYRAGLAGGDGGGRIGIGIGRGLPPGVPTFAPATKHPCPASAAASPPLGLDGRLAGVASGGGDMGMGMGDGGGDAGGAALMKQPFGAPPGAPHGAVGGHKAHPLDLNVHHGQDGLGDSLVQHPSPPSKNEYALWNTPGSRGKGWQDHRKPHASPIVAAASSECVPPETIFQRGEKYYYRTLDGKDVDIAQYFATKGQHRLNGIDHSRCSAGGGHPGGSGLPKDDRDPCYGDDGTNTLARRQLFSPEPGHGPTMIPSSTQITSYSSHPSPMIQRRVEAVEAEQEEQREEQRALAKEQRKQADEQRKQADEQREQADDERAWREGQRKKWTEQDKHNAKNDDEIDALLQFKAEQMERNDFYGEMLRDLNEREIDLRGKVVENRRLALGQTNKPREPGN